VPRQAEHQRVCRQQLQLAMVARPVVLDQACERFAADEDRERVAPRGLRARPAEDDHAFVLVEVLRGRELRQVRAHQRPQRLGAQRFQEREADQVGKVLTPLAQRRYPQPRGGVQPHVQVGTKAPRVYQRLDVFVCRCHELGRRGPRARIAQPGDHPALEHQQQLTLQLEIQVGDLVEKQRPAVCLLEHAGMVLDRSRVSAAPRPEQVRREQRRRNRRQIGDDQRPLRARAGMNDLLGEKALARSRLALDQQRKRRARQRVELAAQLGHRRRLSPEDPAFLARMVDGERTRDLRGEAAAVDHFVLAEVDEGIGGPLGAQVRSRGRQHHDRELRIVRAQLLQDQQALPAPETIQRGLAGLRVLGQRRLVFGQQLLLGQGEVQVEHDEIGQGVEPPQRLRRLAVVVGAAQRTAALALFADLTRNISIAAGDRVELGKLPLDHVDRLVTVVDDEEAGHYAFPSKDRASAANASSRAMTPCTSPASAAAAALATAASNGARLAPAGASAASAVHNAAAVIGCPSSSIRSGTSSPAAGAPPMSRRSRAGQTRRLTRSWRTRASHVLGCIG